eukprot:gene6885-3154_t
MNPFVVAVFNVSFGYVSLELPALLFHASPPAAMFGVASFAASIYTLPGRTLSGTAVYLAQRCAGYRY